LWILFLENAIVFEKLLKALDSSSRDWLPMAGSIPVQSQILCDQTENRQQKCPWGSDGEARGPALMDFKI